MIPRLAGTAGTDTLHTAFLAELRARGFAGDIASSLADRTVFATDNSIYQLTPQAVVFPRDTDDLVRVARAAQDPRFARLVLAARGGGTGTNGQSLTDGVVVDLSRHMNAILHIDAERRLVRVQAGVVKDQLNAALKPHGLFFPPELSTSSRATIGGMIGTDACGQGSCLYGKTRDYVRALTTVLCDGTCWTSRPLDDDALEAVKKREDRIGAVHRLLDRIERDNRALIADRFPKLNRSLTGYDLAHIRTPEGLFDLNAILCGSEGTLGFIAEAELAVLPIPRHSALINIRYDSFDAALRDARVLVSERPASIETVDSRVLELARKDNSWRGVRAFFPDDPEGPAKGINLVELLGDSAEALDGEIARLGAKLGREGRAAGRRGFTVARNGHGEPGSDPGGQPVDLIWAMRKKAVGLLGAMAGARRPVPFVEDTAVPPEHLADYIAEFRALLDRRGLDYGMFGHVDAGVLHVRPALDMTDPAHSALIRGITDEVAALARKYGGVLWGEHGKGVRSEYAPAFFGPLYPCLQAIKAAFDPGNRLNPGKIAAPAEGGLLRIDGVPTRGERDRIILPRIREAYDNALHCNGNGACYSWDPDEAMCPSWKGMRERRHSPKGRAQLLREWLRQLTLAGVDPLAESGALRRRNGMVTLPRRLRNSLGKLLGEGDFSHEVKAAMDGCLGCKSCVGQCPIKVNVPAFRSKFLELYHGRYMRPVRDHVVGRIEHVVPWMAKLPGLANALCASKAGRSLLGAVGLVATPRLSGLDLARELAARDVAFATREALHALPERLRARSVVIVQDAFTSYYETPLLLDFVDLICAIGYTPWLAPYRPNGKALHVHGFLGAFERVAAANAAMLAELSETGVPLVGLDPSMTLTYRAEYAEALGGAMPPIRLPQEWLADHWEPAAGDSGAGEYKLLSHCTQSTTAPASLESWRTVFAKAGLRLAIVRSGCCGMAGTWGHEAEHRAMSEHIYRLGWSRHVRQGGDGRLMADGFSCRSQARLVDGVALPHPLQVLLGHARRHGGVSGRSDNVEA